MVGCTGVPDRDYESELGDDIRNNNVMQGKVVLFRGRIGE